MPTIAAGASALISLAAGSTLKTTGTGIAVRANVPIGLQGANTFGPYDSNQNISISAASAVVYTVLPNQTALAVPRIAADASGLLDPSGNVVAGGGAATITGTYAVGSILTATYPVGVVGTIQFTRTLIASPFTKTPISGAVISSANSLQYTVTSADQGCTISVDCSNQVSSATGGLVPAAQATVKTSGVMRLVGTQNSVAEPAPATSAGPQGGVIKVQAPGAAIGARVSLHNKAAVIGCSYFKVAMAPTDISAIDTLANCYNAQVAGAVNNVLASPGNAYGFVKGTWKGAAQSRRIYPSNGVLPVLGPYNNQEDVVTSDVIPLTPVRATDSANEAYYFILRTTFQCALGENIATVVASTLTTLNGEWTSTNGADSPLFFSGGVGSVDAAGGSSFTTPGSMSQGNCPVISIEWVYPAGIVPTTFWHVGDSITEGYEWPRWAVNRKSTAAKPLHHVNLGGSTTRTASFLGEMYLHLQAMAKPDYVVLPIISVNNYSPISSFSLTNAQDEYNRLVEVATYLTGLGIKVIWWTPFNFGANPLSTDTTSAWGYLYNSAKAYAAAHGITFMDINGDSRLVRSVYNSTSNPTGWIDPDNTHPSSPVGKNGFAQVYTETLTALGF